MTVLRTFARFDDSHLCGEAASPAALLSKRLLPPGCSTILGEAMHVAEDGIATSQVRMLHELSWRIQRNTLHIQEFDAIILR